MDGVFASRILMARLSANRSSRPRYPADAAGKENVAINHGVLAPAAGVHAGLLTIAAGKSAWWRWYFAEQSRYADRRQPLGCAPHHPVQRAGFAPSVRSLVRGLESAFCWPRAAGSQPSSSNVEAMLPLKEVVAVDADGKVKSLINPARDVLFSGHGPRYRANAAAGLILQEVYIPASRSTTGTRL